MEILLATHNDSKAEEVKKMLPKKFKLLTLNEIRFYEEILENGNSFEENAFIKAKRGHEVSGIPTFADDSGLCINSLNDRPGIFSARYAGTRNSRDNIDKVLKELEGVTDRSAYFIANIAFFDGQKSISFEGRINGEITTEMMGKKGFGYDPIFKPAGYDLTFAQMDNSLKNNMSHRFNALKKLIEFLNKY